MTLSVDPAQLALQNVTSLATATGPVVPNPATQGPVRLLRHPGPVAAQRRKTVCSPTSSAFRVRLTPGRILNDEIVSLLYAHGIHSAAINMTGGGFSRLSFCLTSPQGRTDQIASYTAPIVVSGPVDMVMGSGTLGLDEDGETPLLHVHALFTDQSGTLRGGHVFPETAIIGAVAPVLFVRSLDSIRVRRRFDPETNFSLLQPELREVAHG